MSALHLVVEVGRQVVAQQQVEQRLLPQLVMPQHRRAMQPQQLAVQQSSEEAASELQHWHMSGLLMPRAECCLLCRQQHQSVFEVQWRRAEASCSQSVICNITLVHTQMCVNLFHCVGNLQKALHLRMVGNVSVRSCARE